MKHVFYPGREQLKHAWVLLERGKKKPTLLVLVFFESKASAEKYAEDTLGLGGLGYSTCEMRRVEL